MKIYRIEGKNGVGPYQSFCDGWSTHEHNITTGKPPPQHDGITIPESRCTYDYLFGFSSMAQLKAWFSDQQELSCLARLGFTIAVYKIHGRYVRKGEKQVAFLKGKFTKLETIRLASDGCRLIELANMSVNAEWAA